MKKQAGVVLSSRILLRARSSRNGQKEGALTTYWEVVHYLLKIYATDDVIAEPDAKIVRLTQPLKRRQSSMLNVFELRFCVAIESTKTTYSKETLTKGFMIPSGRASLVMPLEQAHNCAEPYAARHLFSQRPGRLSPRIKND